MNKEFIKIQQAAEKRLVTKIKDNMYKHNTTKKYLKRIRNASLHVLSAANMKIKQAIYILNVNFAK